MGKRRQNRDSFADRKRARILLDDEQVTNKEAHINQTTQNLPVFKVEQKDRIEQKVDLIVRDLENNCHRSLTLCGAGLGVEKTIAVVEELKRNYVKNGKKYHQETSIKTDDNNQPLLQIILTILDNS